MYPSKEDLRALADTCSEEVASYSAMFLLMRLRQREFQKLAWLHAGGSRDISMPRLSAVTNSRSNKIFGTSSEGTTTMLR